ncbi:sensor histidine kinase [Salinibacterium soli]|uniref:GAF domain-containing protein n=1 Tax=Antiquaquibacter soli TaxID=3064523 RepID=A0ABT9BP88_9MICO|nr:GAF domain-containing protein [Protaetiibacter sp. WY-16]MDO7882779.1 GAF domain-containing protein [Protaetiibacter sp. WY-16]
MSDPLTFPDGPRSDLEQTIADLLAQAQKVLETESRLRSLLRASKLVADELDLPVVLERIIEAAVELVGARYGAIGVIGDDGMLEQFIHVGLEPDLVERIGHLPRGRGLLGALIEEQSPIRLEHLRDDPRSSGFPDGHPPMDSFLGVPVRVRNEVFGNLYLSDHRDGPFSAEDQELLTALAATAGAAIDHARLFEETRRRQRWAEASAEITAVLLSDQVDDSLSILVERVGMLADADLACIVVPAEADSLRVELAWGDLAESALGRTFAPDGSVAGRALEAGQPILAPNPALGDLPLDMTIAVPVALAGTATGVLAVSRRPGRPRFREDDLRTVADFAGQASLALRLAEGRADRERLALLEDRSRIARDLHDTVIQRLFGAGLSLQALAGRVDSASASRIAEQVEVLDAAIADIRTAIFAITAAPATGGTVRRRVLDLVGELADILPEPPRLSFAGPVDLLVDPDLADDVVAVVREGLSNVARHAGATETAVTVTAGRGVVSIEIVDDGVGMPEAPARSSGLANLATRAEGRGGSFTTTARPTGGTVLSWTAPVKESR